MSVRGRKVRYLMHRYFVSVRGRRVRYLMYGYFMSVRGRLVRYPMQRYFMSVRGRMVRYSMYGYFVREGKDGPLPHVLVLCPWGEGRSVTPCMGPLPHVWVLYIREGYEGLFHRLRRCPFQRILRTACLVVCTCKFTASIVNTGMIICKLLIEMSRKKRFCILILFRYILTLILEVQKRQLYHFKQLVH